MATAATLSSSTGSNAFREARSSPEPNSYVPRGDVSTTLTFYAPPEDGSVPFNYVETPPPGRPQRNYGSTTQPMTIHDARGQESRFSTDTHGFALHTVPPSAETSFTDDASIEKNYYPEVTSLLKERLSAHRVVIFDHTIRRAAADAKRGPVNRVHVDQTPKAAAERVRRHLGDDAEELLKGRYRIINVWRPLNGPVVKNPLGVAASDTVPAEAVIPVEHRYPDRTGETAGIVPKGEQEWWYWSGMGNDERIFLQCFDSKTQKRTAHTAFEDPRTAGEDWKGRESIEVRTLVFG
ncbi:Aspirochlorine biosynthesis protein N-like protein 1 [Elsinoe fawcettii]|nr:Aspirochlorine biosynthesis protein N-like protein 1 [Elsinoe fawcettii]